MEGGLSGLFLPFTNGLLPEFHLLPWCHPPTRVLLLWIPYNPMLQAEGGFEARVLLVRCGLPTSH